MEQVNRRAFMLGTVAAAAAMCCCDLPATLADDTKPVDVGKLADYPADGVIETWAKQPTMIDMVRQNGKLYAVSTKCTHRGAQVKKNAGPNGDELKCPAHGSRFALDGTMIPGGRAKKSLPHYGITVDDAGHILVDKTKVFEEADWNAEGSFIKVGEAATTQPATK